ncbi:MAG: hypothetical protein QOE49_3406 [Rhodospirillaceae bacterium]|nr:hypothetical protein [Rhodospirillaceae bacterium]
MAADSRSGADWLPQELKLIVDDYFSMLRDEQAARPYSKTQHRRALMERIDRSDGSIEFKHQNISAVLIELGLPGIEGYKPAWNYQGAIFDAIGGYLSNNPDPVPFIPRPFAGLAEAPELYLGPAPSPRPPGIKRPEPLERLIRKFDPAARDQLNRALGRAGEERIVEFERRTLIALERSDLARKVRWISEEEGDGAGYDIRSYDPSGAERLIEVKTTRGGNTTPFYLTRNENDLAAERPDAFRLYRLYDYSKRPGLFTLTPPLEQVLQLEPMTFRASLK